MTHEQFMEKRYFDLFKQVADLKAYLTYGGDDIARVNEMLGVTPFEPIINVNGFGNDVTVGGNHA